jgi:hypothetical protein
MVGGVGGGGCQCRRGDSAEGALKKQSWNVHSGAGSGSCLTRAPEFLEKNVD